MAKLVYTAIASLDGYVADEDGNFDWAEPDEEVHAFVNDLERPIGTHLYGRRLYEVMVIWETIRPSTSRPSSRTTRTYGAPPTRSCTPRRWRRCRAPGRGSSATSTPRPYGRCWRQRGPTSPWADPSFAAQAIKAGLVDECHLLLVPWVVGGGKRALPDNVRLKLELLDERRFRSGVVHLHYRLGT